MLQCWSLDERHRPLFEELVVSVRAIITSMEHRHNEQVSRNVSYVNVPSYELSHRSTNVPLEHTRASNMPLTNAKSRNRADTLPLHTVNPTNRPHDIPCDTHSETNYASLPGGRRLRTVDNMPVIGPRMEETGNARSYLSILYDDPRDNLRDRSQGYLYPVNTYCSADGSKISTLV